MKPSAVIVRIVAILLGLLVLYPLSIGPAMYIDFKLHASANGEFDSSPGFARIYTPLFMLYGRNPTYDRCLGWYMDLWQKVIPVRPVVE
ncbi:MAG TPA: hypothetical protein VK961_19655 [Chthoniobacter sp.]|nr:hypothetical protein [Chthoniobacter sp.]